jgi:RimJ/RimL family protein N-acetyltransferase
MPSSVSQPCLDAATGAHSCTRVGEKLLVEGAPVVAIDPVCDNHRARRAFRRAGFVEESIAETANGPIVVMLFSRILFQFVRYFL